MIATPMRRFLALFSLVFAGEAIFSLPFHLPRFFRPTVLDAFGFSNAQLGDAFAAYGVMAMLCYFPGGVIADRYPARTLMVISLLGTALGGVLLASMPGALWTAAIYAAWGVTTILLFWAALIRATRDWGGAMSQGRAFGLLDGGRGLLAALAASLAVLLLSSLLPENAELANSDERRQGLRALIGYYTGLTLIAAALIWCFVPAENQRPAGASPTAPGKSQQPLAALKGMMAQPLIWAQAAIVVCAYCAYKGLDNYALYAVQVLGMDELEGARLASQGAYLRPLAAVAAGILADRFKASRVLLAGFAVSLLCFTTLTFITRSGSPLAVFYVNIMISFCAVFALRGVYFALLEEVDIPKGLTGTAVGVISLVGYTPDVFFGAVSGRILDAAPGPAGHQLYFALLAAIMLCGIIAVAVLIRSHRALSRSGDGHTAKRCE